MHTAHPSLLHPRAPRQAALLWLPSAALQAAKALCKHQLILANELQVYCSFKCPSGTGCRVWDPIPGCIWEKGEGGQSRGLRCCLYCKQPRSLQPKSHVLHPKSDILHPESHISHPAAQISHPASCIPNITSHILQPKSHILQPKPHILHPTSILQPKSHVPHPAGQISPPASLCHSECHHHATLDATTVPHWMPQLCHRGCHQCPTLDATLDITTVPAWMPPWLHIGCHHCATLDVTTMPH